MIPVLPSKAAESKKVRIGYFQDDIFHATANNTDIKRGYGYEYYQMISNYTSWEYEYYYGSWTEIYDAFIRGDIDIIDDISITPERQELMDFSSLPMGEEFYYIFVPQETTSISVSDITTLNGKKIGCNANSLNETLLRQYIKDNHLTTEVVLCSGVEERMQKLASGEIDGMVTTDSFTAEGLRPSYKIGSSDFYFAIQKNRPDLLAELDNAMEEIYSRNPNYNNQLRAKYYNHSIVTSGYTEDELTWLKNNPVIKVGVRSNTLPLADYDYINNKITGLLGDILEEFKTSMNVEFEPHVYTTNDSLAEALSSGEVDFAFPVMDEVWLSEQKGYKQTFSVVSDSMVLLFNDDYNGLENFKTLGYTTGSPAQYIYMVKYGIGENYVPFNTVDDSINAIRKNEIDGVIVSQSMWNFLQDKYTGYSNIKSITLDEAIGYSFAVSKNNVELYSILEANLARLDNAHIMDSVNRHSQFVDDYSMINFIRHNMEKTIAVVLIMLVLIGYSVFYGYQHKQQHKQLSFDSEHDALTGVFNRAAWNRFKDESISNGECLCLGIVDIDDFKTVNDTYGHEVGDQVLKRVAYHLAKEIRSEDILIRFGGDEFLFILKKLTVENKHIILSKVYNVMDILAREEDNLPLTSISVGVAFSENGYTDELFENADQALYDQKKAGKNGCTISENIIKA